MRSFIKAVLRALSVLMFRVKVSGRPPANPDRLLIVANHESFLDGLLLGLFLPLDPVFVVHTGVVRNPAFRLLLSLVDYLAVDPTSPMAMKKVIRLLEGGRPVVIFPEGRITTTGSLMKTYDGPAFVAARTGATILPVRIDGAARTYFSRLAAHVPRRLFPRISLSILPTTRIPMPDAPTARDRRRRAGEAMRRLMQEMIFATRPNQTLFTTLLDAADIQGHGHSLVEDLKQIEYSYRDLIKMALALGRLVARESQPGEKVGLLLPNLAPTLGLIFGLSAQGRTAAMLNYTAGVEGMQAAVTAAQVRCIVTSRAFVEQAKLGDKLPALQGVRLIYLEDLRATMRFTDTLWLLLWALPFPRLAVPAGSPEDAAVVLFTSGSEGKPKGVVLSHRALLANVAQIRAVVDFSIDDKILNALPLFHSFGLTAGGLLPVLTGARVFLYPSPLHYRVIPELAYDRNCTVLLGTSTFLGNYAKFAHPYDFYRLRYVIAGAEKLATPVRDLWFEKFGIRIFEGYGATETAPVLAVNTPMAFRSGTVGQFLPGIQYQLVPVPGIAAGGMLHVKGPNLMSGYLRFENPGVLQPPASPAGDGWYETGDVVEVSDEGFVKIVGRVKRFAKVAGEMVSLEAVEKLAASASPTAAHAASTQPDPARGETILLFSTDPALNREQLQAGARSGGWPEIAVPRRIITVDALPLLGTGKIDYVTLKQWAEKA
ncbi:bifunctional acyl-ACP--phospholipid O-acyltransferase/long-chain-fatty-acid--ACP ligase [Zoogloea sp.]|uniref:bifunctional acyl-ACP--phospholipid O-acyltransferase/long-chain-fatty-acid--ACP ligase n=1 Tax=Zoogloea sp. TaxID=49181 RepID=UPI0011D71318|nr:bifunctional acyl-ACP--phospholipid O-acyltransferase/long-chain-fatty-acid--ACP ligase [Zoogloea sp.]MBP7446032.1 bifunctional acyl-ACP--phospholipid O-acyltransferase/long-chain-fatty-acid--ACP ligase [Zoogloea sp.]TXG99598.1 MAG: bifunctional acyl-ACP--phospholipid O-acyltransferase/long-chain-fatty-acid--ACP ligase [Zoogloea sp.]HPI60785.1 bifunctional acyl-ACP--phospholipid O-acyltransferase/long-chain-fatty-acid--ACP ligase [Zoogloea sp.]